MTLIEYLTNIIKNDTKLNLNINSSKVKGYDYNITNIYNILKENNLTQENLCNLIVKEYEFYKIMQVDKYFYINLKSTFYSDFFDKINNFKVENKQKKVILDYSSPNIAKEMHIGHLRSTIIGDTLANFLEFYGYDVMRINHIGDFGLQFGKIINYIIQNNLEDKLDEYNLQELYELSNKLADDNLEFMEKSQFRTYELQNKINPTYEIHQKICDISRKHFEDNYNLLKISNLEEIGESFYQSLIPEMLNEMKTANIIEIEEGRTIVKTKIGKKDSALTLIKSNGSYTYDTTDLCAIKYRSHVMKADKILYVVDSGQSEHFQQIFQIAEKMNWIKKNQAQHINFGIIQGDDGKRIRSRDGTTLKLLDFLNNAINETQKIIIEKNNTINKDFINKLAIGSLKYADLKNNRTSDYKFSFEKMLSFTGNTLTYIMYGYIRIKKILEKINTTDDKFLDFNELNSGDIELLKHVFAIYDEFKKVDETYEIHHLCIYLYELTEKINNCYKKNRVIDFDSENNIININKSRIIIFNKIFDIYELIFKILNIDSLEYM